MSIGLAAPPTGDDAPERREQWPWWTRAIERFGFPTVVCIALGWMLVTVVIKRMDAYEAHLVTIESSQRSLQLTLDRHVADQVFLNYLAYRICWNTSTTDNERAGCSLPATTR